MEACPVAKDKTRPANPLIEENCPCPRDCPRHGNCFECVANHRDKIKTTPPACLRYMMEKKAE